MNACINDKSAEAQQLFDRYSAIIDLRNTTTDRDTWMRLDHEAKVTWNKWLKAQEAATMRSDPDSYTNDQRMS